MDIFRSIMAGLAIGVQVFGTIYVARIWLRPETPSQPYRALFAGMMTILVIKADYFFHFMTPNIRLFLQMATSVFFTVGFISIWVLLNKKFEK